MEILLQFLQVDCLPYAAVFRPYQGLGRSIGLEVVVYHLPSTHWYINNHMEKIRVTAAAPSWRRPPPQDSRTPSPCPCLPCSHSTRCSQTGRKVETCFPCNSIWSHLFFFLSRARILLLADGGGYPPIEPLNQGVSVAYFLEWINVENYWGKLVASAQTVNTYKDFFHV